MTTRQCYIPNFKHLSQVVIKKKIFEKFSMYFYGSNLGPLARGHLGPWDLGLNKLGRSALGNATYQISNIWAKWFLRIGFLIYFYAFLRFEPRTLGPLFEQNLVKDH